jgi:hypothetical protein
VKKERGEREKMEEGWGLSKTQNNKTTIDMGAEYAT